MDVLILGQGDLDRHAGLEDLLLVGSEEAHFDAVDQARALGARLHVFRRELGLVVDLEDRAFELAVVQFRKNSL